MLAVLAAAYAGGQWLPHRPATRPLAASAHQTIVTDSAMIGQTVFTTLSTDTVALSITSSAEPALAPPPPALAPELPHCPDQPIRFVPPDEQERLPLQLHRYVGTVGGQPTTALLQWRTPDKVAGSFYRHRGGPTYELDYSEGHRATLRVWRSDDSEEVVLPNQGKWHLVGWPGPVLRGTWHDTTGNHPFYLRESYAGAVRADVHTLHLVGGWSFREESSPECLVGSYRCDYLQFPGPWAVAPALRRTLGPPLAIVRRRLRATYEQRNEHRQSLSHFLLNDFNLLSYYQESFQAEARNEGKGYYWTETYLFDLATGRELTLASQLQPGYERPLRRLVRRHLLHEAKFDFINKDHQGTWAWLAADGQPTALPELPDTERETEASIALTSSGLAISYPSFSLYDMDISGQREVYVCVPYAELRSLVRPGTPLARMLRARGMW
jgi:hypothetical protein